MLYTIFGLLLITPLGLLVASVSRTALQVSRGDVATGELPATVVHREAKLGEGLDDEPVASAPAAAPPSPTTERRPHPRLGGRTRPAVSGGARRDYFGDRLVAEQPLLSGSGEPELTDDTADNVVRIPFGRTAAGDRLQRRLG